MTREEAPALVEPLARPVSWLDHYEPYEYLAEIERIQADARAAIAAAEANASANGAGRAPVAAQALAEAVEAREQAMWASYESWRAELIRLRHRIELCERQPIGREIPVAGNGTLGALAGSDGIGPIWLALAARATRLSRR